MIFCSLLRDVIIINQQRLLLLLLSSLLLLSLLLLLLLSLLLLLLLLILLFIELRGVVLKVQIFVVSEGQPGYGIGAFTSTETFMSLSN